MPLLIVALFWLAIGVPWGVSKYRNAHADRSIASFHAEHEVLSRQGYTVAPARRLDDAYLYEEQAYEPAHPPTGGRPRLTVVHDDDTYSSLERRLSWDEWDRDYDYDEPAAVESRGVHPAHRYAAYASSPSPDVARPYTSSVASDLPHSYGDEGWTSSRSMRVRRNRIAAGLVLSALALTGVNYVAGAALVQDLAIIGWIAVGAYVAAALFAISQGSLEASSLVGRRVLAYQTPALDHGAPAEDDFDEAVEESIADADGWGREPRRYALG